MKFCFASSSTLSKCNSRSSSRTITTSISTTTTKGRIHKKSWEISVELVPRLNKSHEFPSLVTVNKIWSDLRSHKIKPSGVSCYFIFESFRIQENVNGMISVYDFIIEQDLIPPLEAFKTMFDIFYKLHKAEKMLDVVRRKSMFHVYPSADEYEKILVACQLSRDSDTVEKVLKQMQVFQAKPSLYLYIHLMNFYKRIGKDSLSESVFSLILSGDFNVTKDSLNSILATHISLQDYQGVKAFIELFSRFKVRPDMLTYTTMLNFYGRTGNDIDFQHIYNVLCSKGFNSRMVALIAVLRFQLPEQHNNKISATNREKFMARLLLKSEKVDSEICSTLINYFSRNSNIDGFSQVLALMSEKEIPKNLRVYNALAESYTRFGLYNRLEDLFEEMKQVGIPTTNYLFRRLIKASCIHSHHLLVPILDKMRSDGVRPNVYVYSFLIQMFCTLENVPAVHQLYEELDSKGLRPRLDCYISMIRLFGMLKHHEVVVRLYLDVRESNIHQLNIKFFTVLVKALEGRMIPLILEDINRAKIEVTHTFESLVAQYNGEGLKR